MTWTKEEKKEYMRLYNQKNKIKLITQTALYKKANPIQKIETARKQRAKPDYAAKVKLAKAAREVITCEHCIYTTNDPANLKVHMGRVHDIGDKKCGICFQNVPFLYGEDKKCINCHTRKGAGKTRMEHKVAAYVKEHFGTEFLLRTDKRVMGDACTKYRPDMLYASPDTVLQIEIDENEHSGVFSYSCDERRISEIYEEFIGKKYVVVRINPNQRGTPLKVKLARLVETMREVLANPSEDQIHIYYLYYSQNNPLISKNIPHTFL